MKTCCPNLTSSQHERYLTEKEVGGESQRKDWRRDAHHRASMGEIQ